MFKYTFSFFDSFNEILILFINIKKKHIKLNKNSLNLFILKKNNLPFYLTNYTLIDFTNITSYKFGYNTLIYVLLSITTLEILNIIFHNTKRVYSRSYYNSVWEWYERELFEQGKIYFFKLIDSRSLLSWYSNKTINKISLFKLQNYSLFTSIQLKNLVNLNQLKIIL